MEKFLTRISHFAFFLTLSVMQMASDKMQERYYRGFFVTLIALPRLSLAFCNFDCYIRLLKGERIAQESRRIPQHFNERTRLRASRAAGSFHDLSRGEFHFVSNPVVLIRHGAVHGLHYGKLDADTSPPLAALSINPPRMELVRR